MGKVIQFPPLRKSSVAEKRDRLQDTLSKLEHERLCIQEDIGLLKAMLKENKQYISETIKDLANLGEEYENS